MCVYGCVCVFHVLMAFITLPARPTYILFCPKVSPSFVVSMTNLTVSKFFWCQILAQNVSLSVALWVCDSPSLSLFLCVWSPEAPLIECRIIIAVFGSFHVGISLICALLSVFGGVPPAALTNASHWLPCSQFKLLRLYFRIRISNLNAIFGWILQWNERKDWWGCPNVEFHLITYYFFLFYLFFLLFTSEFFPQKWNEIKKFKLWKVLVTLYLLFCAENFPNLCGKFLRMKMRVYQ